MYLQVPLTIAAERMEEFSPGLDKDLLELLQATAELEMAEVSVSYGPMAKGGTSTSPGTGNGARAALVMAGPGLDGRLGLDVTGSPVTRHVSRSDSWRSCLAR
jgi:hypothetical protein